MAVSFPKWLTFAGIFSLFIAASVYAWDVQLDCPERWTVGETITLTAKVRKDSLASKCVANPSNNTFFRKDDVVFCQVNPADYSCEYKPLKKVSEDNCSCADSSDDTFYVFVYQFVADKAKHNGTWDCRPSCTTAIGTGYLLDNDNSKSCASVNVTDRECCEDDKTPVAVGTSWESLPIVFAVFRVCAGLGSPLYVLFLADWKLWPIACDKQDPKKWKIVPLICASLVFPECIVICITDAIRKRSGWQRIVPLVLGSPICLVSVVYIIIAGVLDLWPFPEDKSYKCLVHKNESVCIEQVWQIALFVVTCIGLAFFAILICVLIFWPKKSD